MYLRGLLASLDEGARVADVSRMTVLRWLAEAQIDWRRTRLHFLARHRSRCIAACEGKTLPRPSKRELRRLEAAKAKQDWDNAHHDLPTG